MCRNVRYSPPAARMNEKVVQTLKLLKFGDRRRPQDLRAPPTPTRRMGNFIRDRCALFPAPLSHQPHYTVNIILWL